MATTVAPDARAICTRKLPTPPEAPVTSTLSPARSPAISSMFIAVPPEHGTVASCASDSGRSCATVIALPAGTAVNCAKPPSRWAPRKPVLSRLRRVPRRMEIRIADHALADTLRIPHRRRPPRSDRPHRRPGCAGTSCRCPSRRSRHAAPQSPTAHLRRSVPVLTAWLYQPERVLISVLLTPAARTRISTSPGPGRGTGNVLAVFELVQATVTGEQDGGHVGRDRS